MMRTSIALALVLTGCATSTTMTGPTGSPVHAIQCGALSPNACLQKAGELCPAGYTILSSQAWQYMGQYGAGTARGAWNQSGGMVSGSSTSVPLLSPGSMVVECKPQQRPSAMGRTYLSPMYVAWTGRPDVGSITVASSETAGRGELALVLEPGVSCSGAYDLSTPSAGTWSLKCSDGATAGGTISRKNGVSTGTGTDSAGRHVAFYIQPGRPAN